VDDMVGLALIGRVFEERCPRPSPDAQNLRIRCGRATPELNWLKFLADCKPEAVNSVGAVAPLCLVSF